MSDLKLNKHVTAVGVIQIVFGAFALIGALLFRLVIGFASGFVDNDEVGLMVLNVLKIVVPILLAIVAFIKLAGGIGLLKGESWARYLVIVLSAISCLNIPVGTLIGVYSLWVLMQDDVIKSFSNESVKPQEEVTLC